VVEGRGIPSAVLLPKRVRQARESLAAASVAAPGHLRVEGLGVRV